ncbi:MAG: hypothetical protein J5509_01255 [Lachnospiraceae bacterium]|nr:hypothetical protein [Lachnospiraceae bacterium]
MRDKLLKFLGYDPDTFDSKLFRRNAIISFVGIFGMGFFLSFLILAGYGTDPYTFMNRSIAAKLNMSLGNWQLIINVVFLAIVLIFNRRLIGLGTIFNMVLIGYYADFFTWLWNKTLPATLFTDQPARAIIFGIAILCFVISAAVYMNADSGLSPYDGSCKIAADGVQKLNSKIPFFIVRIICDTLVILTGMAAGGRPTVGIIIIAATLGPVITMVGKFMKRLMP